MIVTVALVIAPVVIPGPSEDGTVKLIINVSSLSTMSSSVTGIFTILLLVPAVIVTVCAAELKSSPDRKNKDNYNVYISSLNSKPNAVLVVNMIGILMSSLLTTPPDIVILADITPDDSKPLNVDDVNVINATIE